MNLRDHVIEQGVDGPPIIFIHGSFANPGAWKSMVSILSKDHRCLLLKLPGHAGTRRPGDFECPSLAPEFEILDWVIRERCGGHAHLVGHSFGGAIAMEYALRQAASLRSLTLFEPVSYWVMKSAGDIDSAGAFDRIIRALRSDMAEGVPYACGQIIDFWGGLGSFEGLPDSVKDGMSALERDNLRHWEIGKTLESSDRESDYRALRVPTRLVHGERSNPLAHRIIETLEARIAGSEVSEIEGASHFLVTTHAEQCASEVLQGSRSARHCGTPGSLDG